MSKKVNDFVISVATVNGSGSQSANTILIKSIFRMGIPVGGKNIFPSNIMGLPTWFTIRVNKDGFTCMKRECDFMVAMNQATVLDDLKTVNSGGVFLYNDDLKLETALLRPDLKNFSVPFKKLVDQVTDQIRLKKLLINTIYVGILTKLLNIDLEIVKSVVRDQFSDKASVVTTNLKAIEVGYQYAVENIKDDVGMVLEKMDKTVGKILIEGNAAAGLGLMYGGCTFVSWYPITPSTSVVENFNKFATKYRKDAHGKNTFAIVQAEDELAAICMVMGAGWSGARAMTATSGPGVSLMAEAAGFSYYAEIPAVIWDIQRAGPSTGLPTRTQQADIGFAATLSHGDTKHVLLFPATPDECFEFGQTCFDLAERLQTLVIVMSDIDLGMNLWITDEFKYPTKPFDRGKVVDAEKLKNMAQYYRYEDTDKDGIPYRTLPGTHHPAAGFLTRGSGHNEKAQYTENNVQYQTVLDRLTRKFETAKKFVPKPIIETMRDSSVGIIAFGSSHWAVVESRDQLQKKKLNTDYLRVRAFPFTNEIKDFVRSHERVYVVEQNRDGQVFKLLQIEYPEMATKLKSVTNYDGLPLDASRITNPILKMENIL
ncbi:MAG: ferredoxin oxidoreductase [Proteobacteria bacterium SG_bin7]|nr:MAG: ferredoxin oxidoreductase [Proteobacteria bacterium SG_bin7]